MPPLASLVGALLGFFFFHAPFTCPDGAFFDFFLVLCPAC